MGGIILGKQPSLSIHEDGLETMISFRGGLCKLGLDGHLASTVSWTSLTSSVLREVRPQHIYVQYCMSMPSDPVTTTTTIPESPLYCPSDQFEILKKSRSFNQKTYQLLTDMYMMIEIFLQQVSFR